MLANFKNKDFALFWFAQLISQVGDRFNQMALLGLVAMRNPGSVTDLAKLLAFTIIPVFIVGPIAGVFVDRWDQKLTLFISDILRGLLVLTIPFIFINSESMIPIYIVVFLIFCLSRFHVPAKMSLIPDLVHEDRLHSANSLVSITGVIALVIGALVGGAFVEWYGARGGFIIDACTYFLSAVLVIGIIPRFKPRFDAKEIGNTCKEIGDIEKSFWKEMKEGLVYIGQEKSIQFIFSVMTILFMAAGAIYVTIIIFIQESFNSVTLDLSILAIALGIGVFLGTVAYGKLGKKQSDIKTIFQSLTAGGVMVSVFTCAIQVTQSRLIGIVLALILGFVIGPIAIASNTVIHKICTQEMRGKVFAALEVVMHAGFLVTMLLSSYLADIVGRFWILLSVGVIFCMVGIVGLIRKPIANSL